MVWVTEAAQCIFVGCQGKKADTVSHHHTVSLPLHGCKEAPGPISQGSNNVPSSMERQERPLTTPTGEKIFSSTNPEKIPWASRSVK